MYLLWDLIVRVVCERERVCVCVCEDSNKLKTEEFSQVTRD